MENELTKIDKFERLVLAVGMIGLVCLLAFFSIKMLML